MPIEASLNDWIRRHKVTFELQPRRELVDHTPTPVGFELSLFARHADDAHADPGCPLCVDVYRRLCALAEAALPLEDRATRCDIEPFDASFHLRPEGRWEPELQATLGSRTGRTTFAPSTTASAAARPRSKPRCAAWAFSHARGWNATPAQRVADTMFGAWWDRIRGRLRPRPCPYSLAAALDMRGRRVVAGPERILGAFGIEAGDTIVEVGPGTGFYSVEAARRVGPAGRLICIDLQMEMLRRARGRVAAGGLSAAFIRADAASLPLRSASADHVFLITVLGELPDRERALSEIKRVLKPGGLLSVSEQFPDPDFVTRRALRQALPAAGFSEKRTGGWLVYTSTWSTGAKQE